MSNTVTAYNGNDPYIFVSYSHKDTESVLPAIEAMQRQGYRIWFDRGIEAGTEWSNNIAAHLRDCAAFVAFITKNSVKSENCLDEIAYAKSHGKPSLLIFSDEDVTLPEGTEMQTARFQRMFYNRQASMQGFVENIRSATILSPCRDENIVLAASATRVSSDKNQKKSKPINKNIFIIGAAIALIIISCLAVALVSKNSDEDEVQSSVSDTSESFQATSEVESVAPQTPITMSDEVFDCTFILEGDLYQLPCSLSAFTDKGWAISSSGYSADKLINGANTDSFALSKDGKRIYVEVGNRSGNMMRLDECPIISASVTVEYDAKIEIAKGITLNSTIEEIVSAFGTPYTRDSHSYYESLIYVSDDEYSIIEFKIYAEEHKESTCIELARYKFEDTVTTDTNESLPEYLSQYNAPSKLGNDLYSGVFKLEDGVYRLPVPVKSFIDDGWSISSAPKFVVAGGEERIKLSKNSATVEVKVANLALYQTIPANCVVTSLSVYNSDNAKIELPGGITIGMNESEIDARVTEDMDKSSSEYGISYTYSTSKAHDYYMYLYIDADEENYLTHIRLDSEDWDYDN